jgi:hypothetical protein
MASERPAGAAGDDSVARSTSANCTVDMRGYRGGMATDDDRAEPLEYVADDARRRDSNVWTNRAGEPLDTIDKLAAHLAAAEQAAVGNGH